MSTRTPGRKVESPKFQQLDKRTRETAKRIQRAVEKSPVMSLQELKAQSTLSPIALSRLMVFGTRGKN